MIIKLRDYERIYKTVNSVLVNENADITGACMYFSVYGALILQQHYKIKAQPVAGLAAYHFGDNNILYFGEEKNDHLVGTSNGFHCWIQAEGWLIDFMAPVFPLLLKKKGLSVPSKMIQKPMSKMSGSVMELQAEGDFYVHVEPFVTNKTLLHFTTSLAYEDLAEICCKWYRKPPLKMQEPIIISDGKGKHNTVHLVGERIVAR